MATDKRKHFSGRALASTLSGLSLLGMCVTGVILFIVPPGRVANWTGWTIFGLTKRQWQGLHIWLSLVFMVGACLHLYYNWRPLLSYFKNQVSKAVALRWEWVLSLLVCVVVSVGTLADIKPFSSLLAWNESIKHSWDRTERRAPVPHAELLTLTELAGHTGDVTLETIMANLQEQGLAVDSPEQVVGELAQAHNLTPDALYHIAVGQTGSGSGRAGRPGAGGHGPGGGGGGGGRGIGRMTVKEYCESTGIDLDATLEKLRQAGLKPTESMTFRELADTAGPHPSQIRQLLE